jgi:hypothetical protein
VPEESEWFELSLGSWFVPAYYRVYAKFANSAGLWTRTIALPVFPAAGVGSAHPFGNGIMGLRLRLALFGLVFLSSTTAKARSWHIKPDGTGDVPTIQVGLDSARAGDEVVLAAGSFTWTSQHANGMDMVRMKADVTLRSEAGIPDATVLDAEQHGRVIRCVDVHAAHIEGLTITGGASRYPANGAGIYCTGNSEPLISNCIVRNNTVAQDDFAGGGIWCQSAMISNCQVLDNSVSGRRAHGGGIFCNNTTILNCTVRGNLSYGFDGSCTGGGIAAGNSTITSCVIDSNTARGAFGAAGGGVYLGGGSISNCLFVANYVETAVSGAHGGGLACIGNSQEVLDCIFIGNHALGADLPGQGAAISAFPFDTLAFVTVSNCTLLGNIAEQRYPGGSLILIGGMNLEGGGTVSSTIVASNIGAACGGNATYACSDLYGNSLGDGICGSDAGRNFGADPLFCAVDPILTHNVYIQEGSPCAAGHHPPGAEPCGLIGAGAVGCTIAVRQSTWTEVKFLYR